MSISFVLFRSFVRSFVYSSIKLTLFFTHVSNIDFFTDFTKSVDKESAVSASASSAFAIATIGVAVASAQSSSSSSSSKVKAKMHVISATMRIERYYSSVREEVSPLSPDAATLLERQDYVGFFKACGPTYTRGIRRAQEVTALFQYRSSSRETASQFSTSMMTASWVATTATAASSNFSSKSKFKTCSSSLQIKIMGWGMGLSQEGSETLVATNLQEYNQVMIFAFRSFTQLEDSKHIGMVYGIEVVPWVHNVAFQAAAKLLEEDIIIPLGRSLIPKAYLLPNETGRMDNSVAQRAKYACRHANFLMDKFGYCCEAEHLFFDGAYRTIDNNVPSTDVCRPVRNLDKSIMKDNMSNNGEFVARLDSAFRYKLAQMGTMEKCTSAANVIPDKFLHNVLQKSPTVRYDKNLVDVQVNLLELKLAIDPKGDYSLLKQLGKELDEWIEMFYSPCMAALFGTNVGTTPDVEASFFMAYPWHSHQECMKLSCVTNNFRWDRASSAIGGSCIPGIMTGNVTADIGSSTADNENCAKDTEEMTAADEVCKHDATDLDNFITAAKDCWSDLPMQSISYMVENYCLPQVTFEKRVPSAALVAKYESCQPSFGGTFSYDGTEDLESSASNPGRRRRRLNADPYDPYGSLGGAAGNSNSNSNSNSNRITRKKTGSSSKPRNQDAYLLNLKKKIQSGAAEAASRTYSKKDKDFVNNLKARIDTSKMDA